MSNDQKQPTSTVETGVPLEAGAAALQKLCKVLGTAIKSRAFERPEFAKQIEEASKLANQVDWVALKAAIDAEAKAYRQKNDANLQVRREKFQQAALAAKVPAAMGAQADRVALVMDYFLASREPRTASQRCNQNHPADGTERIGLTLIW